MFPDPPLFIDIQFIWINTKGMNKAFTKRFG